jgi:hypothetical protein
MTYTPEILEDIMLDAKHGFSLSDIALRLNIPYSELYVDYLNSDTEVKTYFDAGISQGRVETDKALYELAKNGSTSAKAEYNKKLLNSELETIITEILNT